MINDEISLDDTDKDFEKKVENYAKDTLKEVENKSKMFGITVNQITNAMNVRKWNWRKY